MQLTVIHLFLAAIGVTAIAGSAWAEDRAARADLEEVARRAIFFGHQSVGRNVLDGLERLARREGVPLRVVETDDASSVAPGTFAHGAMAANGDPARKLASFERALERSQAELALLKFCYVDFGADSDAAALFARYQSTLATLRARHPQTTFVHVTVPLTIVQGGTKALAKRLLGREPGGVAENATREQYNALLRSAYAGKEPLFDLARVESTAPDGRAESFERGGRAVPALVPAFTSDGGHLNEEGQARAARELVAVLAAASRAGIPPREVRR